MARNARPRGTVLDRNLVRERIRRLGPDAGFELLERAIDVLTDEQLAKVVGEHLPVAALRATAAAPSPSLDDELRAFVSKSLAGRYYEAFVVNSRNCTDTSGGTLAFKADLRRLLDRCLGSRDADPAALARRLEQLFELLEHIDEGHDDVVFFADEAGTWQLGIPWPSVLPVWIAAFATCADPATFGATVAKRIRHFDRAGRDRYLAVAAAAASEAQRRELTTAVRNLYW